MAAILNGMDRREFMRGLLGLAAASVLPAKAETFLADTLSIPDGEFIGMARTQWVTLTKISATEWVITGTGYS